MIHIKSHKQQSLIDPIERACESDARPLGPATADVQARHLRLRSEALHLFIFFILIILNLFSPGITRAEITTDGTVGAAMDLEGPDYQITQDLGTINGSNLFHSFNIFNLNSGESATFSGSETINNIFSRVTGGTTSWINGTLSSTIDGANFYFINPAGVIFGQGASLDISGSFYVSSADYILFENGGRFDATQTEQSTLSSYPLSAFGFLDNDPGSITFQGAQISVADGKTLSIVGGDITLEEAMTSESEQVESVVKAPQGNLNLISIKSSGEVVFGENISTTAENFGDISITNGSRISIDGKTAGSLYIRSGNLVIENTNESVSDSPGIYANKTGDDYGGDIEIDLDNNLVMKNMAEIVCVENGNGEGGSIAIKADHIDMSEDSLIWGTTMGSGRGPDIDIEARSIELTSGGNIDCSAYGPGQGGNVTIHASESIQIDGYSTYSSGLYMDAYDTGDAGELEVSVPNLEITDQGVITGNTYDEGNGADISLQIKQLELSGGGQIRAGTGDSGNGGNLEIYASNEINISGNGSVIGTQVQGSGDCGYMIISTPYLSLTDEGCISGAVFENSSGNGASIELNADAIEMSQSSSITIANYGDGNAGHLNISGQSMSLDSSYIFGGCAADGNGGDITISSEQINFNNARISSFCDTGDGNCGDITIETNQMELVNSSILNGTYYGTGNSGDISITADEGVIVDGSGYISSASCYGTGDGGDIYITASDFQLKNNAVLTASTTSEGDGGDIQIHVDTLDLDNATIETRSSDQENKGIIPTGDAGSILINATSSIDITNEGIINTSTKGYGNAGNISIETAGDLSASPGNGEFGTVIGAYSLSNGFDGYGGNAGSINISANNLNLDISYITSMTDTSGSAQNISLNINDTITLGGDYDGNGWASSITSFSAGSGNGGNISINCSQLDMQDHTAIGSDTNGTGSAGNIDIVATGDIRLAGANGLTTSISSSSLYASSNSGDGGDLSIQADNLSLAGDSVISTLTQGGGSAGDINIDLAGQLYANGENAITLPSAILASAGLPLDTPEEGYELGKPGNITLKANEIALMNGATISAMTEGAENGGRIIILADGNVSLSGMNQEVGLKTQISCETSGTGDAGDIQLTSSNLTIKDGALIVSQSTDSTGKGGSIELNITKDVNLYNGYLSVAASGADGGDINLNAGHMVYQYGGSMTTEAGGEGRGGNIYINSDYIILENTLIKANAYEGDGGNIGLISRAFISDPASTMDASSNLGVDGEVNIAAPEVDIAQIESLPASFADLSHILNHSCADWSVKDSSSLVVAGRDGVPAGPEDPLLGISPELFEEMK